MKNLELEEANFVLRHILTIYIYIKLVIVKYNEFNT